MTKETRGVKAGTKRGKYDTPKAKRTVISFAIEPERKKELKDNYPELLQALFNDWQKKL